MMTDLAKLLADLVAIESVNPVFGGPGEGELAAWVEAWLSKTGADVAVQEVLPGRSNVIAVVGSGSGPALLLDSHLDTVSADTWADGDPFRPEIREGRLYGRGACDTKASMAVFLYLISHYASKPTGLSRPLVFAATIDEEDRQTGAYRLLDHDFGVEIGAAVAGEPTSCRLIHAHKGLIRFRIEARGRAAHASNPSLGDNAIARMGRVLDRLAGLIDEFGRRTGHPRLGRPTLNPGTIRGGSAVNVVPDRCLLELDRRLIPGETADDAVNEILALLEGEPDLTLTRHYDRPALDTPTDSPFVQEFGKAIDAGGRDARPEVAGYLTNAVAFVERDIPSIVFGPGDVAPAHTDHEYVDLTELEAAEHILRIFLDK
jgi:acetylornithine deacetylase